MTKKQAKDLVTLLKSSFPRQEIEPETIMVYALELVDLDPTLAETAVRTLIRTSRFFPTIAEIRETAAELQLDAPTPRAAFEQARGPRGDRHALVRRARIMVGDDWHWKETPVRFLERPFLESYTEVRTAALRELTQGLVRSAIETPERSELTTGQKETDVEISSRS